ncbi:MAG: contractile injection system protein, VgrG/Pvc8 family [Pacificimonas sp.]|jgi:phage protein D|nr:contractile injection system protein, VgrG/Pvc8 family [Pacificimonas sp.]
MTSLRTPAWRLSVDGRDMTNPARPYLQSLSVSEKREDAADRLSVTLLAEGFANSLPRAGSELALQLGWEDSGLVDKGRFILGEITHAGPPDIITLTAQSADMTAGLKTRRDQSWTDTALGDVLKEVAGRHGLTPRIAADLAARLLALVTQSRESDFAFLKRLGRENDAVATIKAGHLLFTPMGAGQTVSGSALPSVTVRRMDGDKHSLRVAARTEHDGVKARWHDRKGAKQESVELGGSEKVKTLRKIYPTEAEARRAGEAELRRLGRAPQTLTLTLAFGQPQIGAEQPLVAEGFHPGIDGQSWIVKSATHKLSATSGLTTDLEAELAA